MSLYPPSHPAPAPPTRRRGVVATLLVVLAVLVVLLGGIGAVAVVQTARLGDARDARDDVAEALDDAERRIDDLRADLEVAAAEGAGQDDPDDSAGDDPSGDVPTPGDPFAGDLEGLLDDLGALLGEDGPLGDAGALDGLDSTAACLEGSSDLPDIGGTTVAEQVEGAVAAVEAIRGSDFPTPLTPTILTSAEVAERIAEEVDTGYSADAAEADRAILSLLGVVPTDIDLAETQTDLLSAQVAGFYDPTTGELVVRSDDPDQPLDTFGLITMVHELEHALADATVGLPDLSGLGTDEDGALAQLAVVEGDAVAVNTIATSVALSPADLLALLSDPDALTSAGAGLEGVPPYLAASLAFPYVAGPAYVCEVFASGGWPAVDALLRDPPTTTAEVLYGRAAEPVDPDPLPAPPGWTASEERTFGAAQLTWLFEAPGMSAEAALEDPLEAARGWRGGTVTLWEEGSGADALTLSLVDGGGLCDHVRTWWERTEALVPAHPGEVVCSGGQVRVGVATTAAGALAAAGG